MKTKTQEKSSAGTTVVTKSSFASGAVRFERYAADALAVIRGIDVIPLVSEQ